MPCVMADKRDEAAGGDPRPGSVQDAALLNQHRHHFLSSQTPLKQPRSSSFSTLRSYCFAPQLSHPPRGFPVAILLHRINSYFTFPAFFSRFSFQGGGETSFLHFERYLTSSYKSSPAVKTSPLDTYALTSDVDTSNRQQETVLRPKRRLGGGERRRYDFCTF